VDLHFSVCLKRQRNFVRKESQLRSLVGLFSILLLSELFNITGNIYAITGNPGEARLYIRNLRMSTTKQKVRFQIKSHVYKRLFTTTILLKPHSFIYGHIFIRSRVSGHSFSYRTTSSFIRRPSLHTTLHMRIFIVTVDHL